MDYMSVAEAAVLWGISGRMIGYYCVAGRISGAQKIGATWIIPKTALKPEDRRKKENRKNGSPGGRSDAEATSI